MIEKVTAILMHYVFSRDGVVTHFMHSYDDFDTLYFKFPHLYCISILEDVPGGRQVMGPGGHPNSPICGHLKIPQ